MTTLNPRTTSEPRSAVDSQPDIERPKAPVDDERPIKVRYIVMLSAVSVLLALPVFLHGPMVAGHDTYEHLFYCRFFAEQFWKGEAAPKWLLEISHGLGSPSFFVYPPLAAYLNALLQPPASALHFNAFNLGQWLALLASGLCAFFWLKTRTSQWLAALCASLYMLMPYHLAIDFYRRTALSECWALAWMPLLLLFTERIIQRISRVAIAEAAAAYALLILSHMVSVVIFSIVPLAMTLVFAPSGKKLRSFAAVSVSMALGIGLSGFYFLPALDHAHYFPVLRLLRPAVYDLPANLFQRADLIGSTPTDPFVHEVAISAFGIIALIALCAGIVILRGDAEQRKAAFFWAAACVVPMVLMYRRSLPIWQRVTPMLQAIQYPWRLNIVLCIAALAIAPAFLVCVRKLSRLQQMAAFGVVAVIVATWFVSYAGVWKSYRTDVALPRVQVSPRLLVNDDDGWFEAWSVTDLDQRSALQASSGPRARFIEGEGSVDVEGWMPRRIRLHVDSAAGGWVRINQFYYPRWVASYDGAQPLQIEPALPEGLVKAKVPPGVHEVSMEIPIGASERGGRWLSLVSLLIWGSALVLRRPTIETIRQPRRTNDAAA
jgi:hypothetical protein